MYSKKINPTHSTICIIWLWCVFFYSDLPAPASSRLCLQACGDKRSASHQAQSGCGQNHHAWSEGCIQTVWCRWSEHLYILFFKCGDVPILDSSIPLIPVESIYIYSLLGSRYFVSNSFWDKIKNFCHLILNSACKSNFIAE